MPTLAQTQLFNQFLADYGDRYNQVRGIIRLLDAAGELCRLFNEFEPIAAENLDTQQMEYLWLLNSLENPVDRHFFKRHWVAVGNRSYDFFIDLSSDKQSLFCTHFFFFKPYRWFRQTVVHDIRTLLTASCRQDLEPALNAFETALRLESNICFRAHRLFGWRGNIKPKKMTIKQLFINRRELLWQWRENDLVIAGAQAGIISLLPSHLPLKISEWSLSDPVGKPFAAEQTTVAGFCFLIQSLGIDHFGRYTVSFSNGNSTALFDSHQHPPRFELKHADKRVIERLVVRLKRLNPYHP